MKFIGLDLVANSPDASGRPGDPTERLTQTVENAILFEELGGGLRRPVRRLFPQT